MENLVLGLVEDDEVVRLAVQSTLMLRTSSATRSSENLSVIVQDDEVDGGGGDKQMVKNG